MAQLDVVAPHFTDRVMEAQRLSKAASEARGLKTLTGSS